MLESRKPVVITTILLVLVCISSVAAKQQAANKPRELSVEVFHVLDLPLSVGEVRLTQTKGGWLLKCTLANNSGQKIIGLRYALANIDDVNASTSIANVIDRAEGLTLPAYATETLTLPTPIRLKVSEETRLLFMVVQTVSHESIWEVIKAREAVERYCRGDYSVIPQVLRAANQVDAPISTRRMIY